ncbi:MAG: single-stranded DNA-binding protein [Candidatus Coprovivens sp.]
MINTVFVVGRTTKDIEIMSKNDKKYCKFDIAIERYAGGNKKEVDYFHCVAFGFVADYLINYAKKGSKLSIQGHLQNSTWTDKQGSSHTQTNIIVDNVDINNIYQSDSNNTQQTNTKVKKQEQNQEKQQSISQNKQKFDYDNVYQDETIDVNNTDFDDLPF